MTDRMRIVDGQGKIIPDSIAETRIASLPPGVTAVSPFLTHSLPMQLRPTL